MRTINLTSLLDGSILRINPDHIVAYWNENSGSIVSVTTLDTNGMPVKETAEQIDQLLRDAP